jgi:8-oxo-dGTP pyrophosphatase MutT (NUDIX family)
MVEGMTEDLVRPTLPNRDESGMAPRVGGRAVRPRHAATLMLVRRDQAKPQVLMGRRGAGHVFMPDKWVFPGGRIDPSDYKAPHATDLKPDVLVRMQHGVPSNTPAHKARALAMAAIRETFEEAGLLLAKPGPTRSAMGPWRDFLKQGVMPDLDALEYIARAITPPMVPKRFDARFFMADAARLVSLERQPDCGELDEIAWFDLDKALELDLPTVTRIVLKEIDQRLDDPDRHVPFLRTPRGKRGAFPSF